MNDDMPKPPLRFELQGGDSIKMTYGLEMDLRRLIPDAAGALQLIMSDPYTQDYVVRRALTDSPKMITDDKELIDAGDVKLDSEETEKLLMWVLDHVLYFFVKRAMSVQAMAARYNKMMPTPLTMPTPAGSADSASTTPSAGPTE